jgi:hypothetical protein
MLTIGKAEREKYTPLFDFILTYVRKKIKFILEKALSVLLLLLRVQGPSRT